MGRYLVTGGAGFIGSHFVRALLEDPENEVTTLDNLAYSADRKNIADVSRNRRHRFVSGDICNRTVVDRLAKSCETIINFAAESHVDRSIIRAGTFVRTNVLGTATLLDVARRHDSKFLQVSTDEVYGPSTGSPFKESDPLNTSSPYSATKGGAELLVKAFVRTYGLHAVTTRSCNVYGPNQFPEKLIPLAITTVLRGRHIPLYGDGLNVREWLYVTDDCRAIMLAAERGRKGSVFNIGSGDKRTNLEVAKAILNCLGETEEKIEFVKDRPGHDREYSLDSGLIRQLGWSPAVPFEEGLRRTVEWYKANRSWWKNKVRPR